MPEKIEGQPNSEDESPEILDASKEDLERQKDQRVKDAIKREERAKTEEGKNLPDDWLPDGTDAVYYLKEDKEWLGLEKRIGQPRILKNVYFQEVFDWVHKKYEGDPDSFSYFEAGCGHGNDLRAIKKKLGGKGRFLGVDISKAEIMHGMEYYQQQERENTEESRELFAQGDLRDLNHINIWDEGKGDFSQQTKIQDNEFGLVYMEAVLHGLGYGKKTYQDKKESAQQMLDELYRICKVGGRFFGRASVFGSNITKEQQFKFVRQTNEWRFIPEVQELEEMLKQAGFKDIKINTEIQEEGIEKGGIFLRFSFLAEK